MLVHHKTHEIGFRLWRESFFNLSLKLIPTLQGIIAAEFLSRIVDRAMEGNSYDVLKRGAGLLALVLVFNALSIVVNIGVQKISARGAHRCKLRLYQRFLSNPLHLLYQIGSGSVMERFNDDFQEAVQKYISLYPEIFGGLITMLAYLGYLIYKSPLAAVILLALSLVQLLPPVVIKKYMQANYDECRDMEGEITDFVMSGYQGFDTIKLYDLKKWWLAQLTEYYRRYKKIGNHSTYAAAADEAMSRLVTVLLTYGSYGIIGALVLFGRLSMETGVGAVVLAKGLYAAVGRIFADIPGLGIARRAEQNIQKLCHSHRISQTSVKTGRVSLDHVSVSYHSHRIFHDKSICFAANGITLIKGANGAGKSTMLRLIAGILQCESGEVFLDGINTKQLCPEDFPRRIFYLPQKEIDFELSALELYQILCETCDDALKLANAFGIRENTLKDRRMDQLSGGEKKKVYLSLAFALNPVLLLLDEPTNSLDDGGRKLLKKLLRERKDTTIVVTHEDLFDDIAGAVYYERREKA